MKVSERKKALKVKRRLKAVQIEAKRREKVLRTNRNKKVMHVKKVNEKKMAALEKKRRAIVLPYPVGSSEWLKEFKKGSGTSSK